VSSTPNLPKSLSNIFIHDAKSKPIPPIKPANGPLSARRKRLLHAKSDQQLELQSTTRELAITNGLLVSIHHLQNEKKKRVLKIDS
jgi:hypothetical protein